MRKAAIVTVVLLITLSAGQTHAQVSTGRAYTIQADDWLSKIAEKEYGDPLAYPVIVEATNAKSTEDDSFSLIDNPDVIKVGQKVWLPELSPAEDPAAISPVSPADQFPLAAGQRWIYRADHYDTFETTPITATYILTRTVTQVTTTAGVTIAEVQEASTPQSASVEPAWLVANPNYLVSTGLNQKYWLVSDGHHVYQQFEFSPTTLETDGILRYRLPLTDGDIWYPDPTQRQMFPDLASGPNAGKTIVSGPSLQAVPAGTFENCYQVMTIYNGGSTFEWVCPGVGVVKTKFDHVGTPFGYETRLVAIGNQP